MKMSSLVAGLVVLFLLTSVKAHAQIEEIIVTAQKREQSLQEVSAAVTVNTEDTLTKAGITSSQNLDLVTPGLTMTESVFVPQPVIRGISTSNRNPGDEASVPTFVDGMYQPWQYAAFFEYNNIERVEVLRGPQGTLFGRNATGGAMNIVTKRPTYETNGEVGVRYNSFNEMKVDGYFSTGLSENVAVDVGFFTIDGGGYYDDIVTGESLGDHDNTWSVRTKLLYEPTENTEITLVYNYTDFNNNLGFIGQPLNGNSITAAPAAGANALPTQPWEAAQNGAELTQEQHSGGLTIKHEFDGFYIESLTGFQETDVLGFADIDATIIPAASFQPNMVSESLTQAVHLVSDSEAGVQWIVGAFYMSDTSGYSPFVIQLGPNVTNLVSEVDTTAYALFAEGTFDFDNGLSLTTGVRYSREEKDYASNVNGTDVFQDSDSWSDVSPRVVLGWQFSDSANAYVSYSQAFKSGTYNSADAFSPAVNPEDLEAWEAGLKWDASDVLRLNFAAFAYQHENLQVTSRLESAAATSLLLNAAEVVSYGFEAEALYAPSENLNLYGGYSFLNSEYERFEGAVLSTPNPTGGNTLTRGDVSGGDNIKSPDNSLYFGGTYTQGLLGGTAVYGANLAWTDDFIFEPDGRIVNPSHWNLNASATWTPASGSYEVSLFGSNLLDEEYFTSVISNPAADNVRYAPPRTFGVRFTLQFD